MAAAGFLSRYLSGPLPYVRRHITVNMLSASLNKTFPISLNSIPDVPPVFLDHNANTCIYYYPNSGHIPLLNFVGAHVYSFDPNIYGNPGWIG